MLTIKQITENTEAVLRGLEKKHFKNAKETIDQVIALNDKRRSTQNELDKNLAEVNSLSRTIGQLMKEGKKEEAETARARVAELKEGIAFSQVWMVPSGIPNSLAALAPPISLASFTACTLYSWSYLRATLNTSLFSWFYYEILENKLSTFFIPHQSMTM